jgi:hypothetical protein
MPEITRSMEKQYAAASLLVILGAVVVAVKGLLFGSHWGLAVGGIICVIGCCVNPEGLSNQMIRELRAARGR